MTDWVVDLIDAGGATAVLLLMFLETVFPPIPSELIMSIAGIRAGQGEMSMPAIIAAGTTGAMLGNIFWYALARALGIERFKPIIDRWGRWLTVTWSEIERGRKWFADYGTFFVFMGRMLPTVRSLVSIPAGLLSMRWKSFLIASTLGTAGWTALLAYAGYTLGSQFEDIDDFLGPISSAIIATLVLGYVWRLWTHRNVKPQNPIDR